MAVFSLFLIKFCLLKQLFPFKLRTSDCKRGFVRPPVRPSVCWCARVEKRKPRILAPAHPSATGIGRVSGLVWSNTSCSHSPVVMVIVLYYVVDVILEFFVYGDCQCWVWGCFWRLLIKHQVKTLFRKNRYMIYIDRRIISILYMCTHGRNGLDNCHAQSLFRSKLFRTRPQIPL